MIKHQLNKRSQEKRGEQRLRWKEIKPRMIFEIKTKPQDPQSKSWHQWIDKKGLIFHKGSHENFKKKGENESKKKKAQK